MAKTNGAANRSASINLNAEQGRNALAAWKMLCNLFGARATSFNVTPEGVEINGFSVSGEYNPETVIRDISSRTRRLDLLTTLPWINGQTPEPYADASEITADTVQFYKGAVEEGSARTPKYVKDATAAFKAEHNLTKKRGPKPRVVKFTEIGNLDAEVLKGINPEDLAKLQATIESVMASQASGENAAATAAS